MSTDDLRKRANGGDPDAMYKLGLLYESGDGVMQNTPIALERFRQAAGKGHEGAKDRLERLSRKSTMPLRAAKTTNQPEADPVTASQNDLVSKSKKTLENNSIKSGQRFYFTPKNFKMNGATMSLSSDSITFRGEHIQSLWQDNLNAHYWSSKVLELKWNNVNHFAVISGDPTDRTDRIPPRKPTFFEDGLLGLAWTVPQFRPLLFAGSILFYILDKISMFFSIESLVEGVSDLARYCSEGFRRKDIWNYDTKVNGELVSPCSAWYLDIGTRDGGWIMIDRIHFIDGEVESRLDLRMELRLFLEVCEYIGEADERTSPDQAAELWNKRKEEIPSYIKKVVVPPFWGVQGIYIVFLITFLIGALTHVVSSGGIHGISNGNHMYPAFGFLVIGAGFNIMHYMTVYHYSKYIKKYFIILYVELFFAAVIFVLMAKFLL
tara:strand:- start:115 stop:1419 length:1305 start_codon:yes stop_codon:yes gene_type:complete